MPSKFAVAPSGDARRASQHKDRIVIVCLCHRISDRDIARAAKEGCPDYDALQEDLRVGTSCGACDDCARTVFATCSCAGAASAHHAPAAGARLAFA